MQLAQILRSVECGVCVTEVQGQTFPLVWSNSQFENLTGYSADALAGRDPWFLHTGICPEAEAAMKDLVARGKSCRGIIQISRADGDLRWVEVTGRPAREDGDPRLFGTIDDRGGEWQKRLADLSPRLQRAFSLLVNGVRIKMAASIMGIGERSARNYRTRILDRLSIEDFSDLYLLRY